MSRTGRHDDEDGAVGSKARPAVKMSYEVKAHWRDHQNRHYSDMVFTGQGGEGEDAIQIAREAWAEFHHASANRPMDVEDYTVDLLEERLRLVPTEKGPGFYQRDGQVKHLGNSNARDGVVSGAELRTISRADIAALQALAKGKRLDSKQVADPCTTCGTFSRDLRYSPDGLPYCPGHLPVDVETI